MESHVNHSPVQYTGVFRTIIYTKGENLIYPCVVWAYIEVDNVPILIYNKPPYVY